MINRRVMIFAGLLLLLVVGGGVTSFIAAEGGGSLIPGVLTVTSRPEASVNQFGGNQGLWLFIFIVVLVGSLVGASAVGAFIFWGLNREIERAKVEEAANHESIVDALGLPRRPDPDDDDADNERELPATT
jgi:hypothetical protein